MTITIGEQKLAIRKPADLNAALLATTGCDADEIAVQLAGAGTAAHLARALHPHIGDAFPVQELAVMIAAADLPDVYRQVRALYEPAPEPAKGKGGGDTAPQGGVA